MAKSSPTDELVIHPARTVITMHPGVPRAEAVAVRSGRIVGVGSVEELKGWGEHRVDRSFADHVLMPGFVEAHTHVMSGGLWQFTYVGYFDRRAPDGEIWSGCRSIDEVVARLVEVEAKLDDGEYLIAWGLDPIYFPSERLVARHLDRVSATRSIFVFHASGHLATVNSALLAEAGIDEETTTPGVSRDETGRPDGELQEPPAMSLVSKAYGALGAAIRSPEAKWNFAREARNSGHTTITDLGTTQLSRPDQVEAWRKEVESPDYPARVMVAMSSAFGGPSDPNVLSEIAVRLRGQSSDKLKFGIVKLILDGSIQGFTARVSAPHYFRPPPGHPGNGLWLIAPEQMREIVLSYHRAGLTVHCHCNGDEAAEVFIDAVANALEEHPRWDHRHTVQHCQLTTQAQYRRMAALGMHANIFANHIFYWGDQHRDVTVGPDRAAAMDACGTALREGVPFAIHSDTPVTPMGSLHTVWCAVNRLTASGEVLGPDERVPVGAALEAVTVGAARQLGLDHEIGSIEAGKLADFAVLDDDPFVVDADSIKDIGVWGTVVGGVAHQAGAGE